MSVTIGERYEPFHKMRNSIYSLLTYSHCNSVYHVTLEQSADPSVYNFVHIDSHRQTRCVVGKITGLPTYTDQHSPYLEMFDYQKNTSVKSEIHKIIKSPCSEYVIIQMSESNKVECYSITPEFGQTFEIFTYKLFEYEPVNAPVQGVNNFFGQGLHAYASEINYTFTPSGKFIYCTYDKNLIKLDTLTGQVVYKGEFEHENKGQLIPINDEIVCHVYTRGYNRDNDTEDCVWAFTEHRLVFQLGSVTDSGCVWLDTLKVRGDDVWIKSATFGQLFDGNTKITCIISDNELHFTYESKITWCIIRIPICLDEHKFGQGRITYQHPMSDRDTLCPILMNHGNDSKLYGVIMNNANFQLVAIKDTELEVLAAGHHFNLPGKISWDHSKPPCEIDYVDSLSNTQKPTSLIDKISGMVQKILTNSETEPKNRQNTEPTAYTRDTEYHKGHITDDTQIDHIEFTHDISYVFISYESGTYVYKGKLSYREVGELVDTMDNTLAGLGIDLPVELISDIACTVAEPDARLFVNDVYRVPMNNEELEFKVAVYENDRINDIDAKIKKSINYNNVIPPAINTRSTNGIHNIQNIQYNNTDSLEYNSNSSNNKHCLFGKLG